MVDDDHLLELLEIICDECKIKGISLEPRIEVRHKKEVICEGSIIKRKNDYLIKMKWKEELFEFNSFQKLYDHLKAINSKIGGAGQTILIEGRYLKWWLETTKGTGI